MKSNYIEDYLIELGLILAKLDRSVINSMITALVKLRERSGRLFILGVGGSAANASHAINDFRKIAEIEAYAPTDNVSEVTARTNDEGWDSVFVEWLKISKLNSDDLIMVFSVGGGSTSKNISANLVRALKHACDVQCKILSIVGKKNGYAARVSNLCLVVPLINENRVTPYTETIHSVVWHLMVSDPRLQKRKAKVESSF